MWDALTSDRSYRPAWPADKAAAHLLAGRGTQFDPRCVDAFLDYLRDTADVDARTPGSAEEAVTAAAACHSHADGLEHADGHEHEHVVAHDHTVDHEFDPPEPPDFDPDEVPTRVPATVGAVRRHAHPPRIPAATAARRSA